MQWHARVDGRILNLDARPDRWRHMQPYHRIGKLEMRRFAAIAPTTAEAHAALSLRARCDLERGRRTHEGIASRGAVGCALSHVAMWREFLAGDKEFFLVLEDDIRRDLDLEPHIRFFVESRVPWDIGLLGWVKLFGQRLPRAGPYVLPFPAADGFFGTHAYMLTRAAAQTLVQRFFPIEMQVDFFLQSTAWDAGLRMLCIPDTLPRVRQDRAQGSDIAEFCLTCEPMWIKLGAGVACLLIVALATALLFR